MGYTFIYVVKTSALCCQIRERHARFYSIVLKIPARAELSRDDKWSKIFRIKDGNNESSKPDSNGVKMEHLVTRCIKTAYISRRSSIL